LIDSALLVHHADIVYDANGFHMASNAVPMKMAK
jgi:hypothetical protein